MLNKARENAAEFVKEATAYNKQRWDKTNKAVELPKFLGCGLSLEED